MQEALGHSYQLQGPYSAVELLHHTPVPPPLSSVGSQPAAPIQQHAQEVWPQLPQSCSSESSFAPSWGSAPGSKPKEDAQGVGC